MDIARSLRLSFYDASYIQLAKKHSVELMTAADEMQERASKIVKTIHLREVP